MSAENDSWEATRRGFLGVAAGLTGAALLKASSSEAAAPARSFVAGAFALEVDGAPAGMLKSVEGGDVSGQVVTEPTQTFYAKKHLGNLKYEDFELQAGFGMSKVFYDWIAASWRGQAPRHDGAVDELDFRLRPVRSREFFDALITEVGIPACDASSKEPSYLTVKLSPELTRPRKPAGQAPLPAGKGGQKRWLPANFRLQIDGLDCTRVSKIEALTIKQTVVTDQIGETRDYQKEPGTIEFPNLVVTLSDTSAATWNAWFEDFVIKGNVDDAHEKGGTLELLAPDLVDVLATIQFFNLGIFRLTQAPVSAGDRIRRLTAELYCERMEISFGGGSSA